MKFNKGIFYVISIVSSPIFLIFILCMLVNIIKKILWIKKNNGNSKENEKIANIEEEKNDIVCKNKFNMTKFVLIEIVKCVSIPTAVLFSNYFIAIKLLDVIW
ncbi:hypothetical protein [Clostridium ihumii]|uniref:hypothetical protein n=1 Tax=Clostridium ihumii TaxID=1470356 RepID=UPI00054DB96A|nr:hypothetical protein [Clostridium ihumii]